MSEEPGTYLHTTPEAQARRAGVRRQHQKKGLGARYAARWGVAPVWCAGLWRIGKPVLGDGDAWLAGGLLLLAACGSSPPLLTTSETTSRLPTMREEQAGPTDQGTAVPPTTAPTAESGVSPRPVATWSIPFCIHNSHQVRAARVNCP